MLRMWVIDRLGPVPTCPDWSPDALAADTLGALTLTPAQAQALALALARAGATSPSMRSASCAGTRTSRRMSPPRSATWRLVSRGTDSPPGTGPADCFPDPPPGWRRERASAAHNGFSGKSSRFGQNIPTDVRFILT